METGETIKQKKKPGPVAGKPTAKITVLLDPDDLDWGKRKKGGLSSLLRSLMHYARMKEEAGEPLNLTEYE